MKAFRQLSLPFAEFLDGLDSAGDDRWPKYAFLRRHSARHHWAFTNREYSRLRQYRIAAAPVVESLIECVSLHRSEELQAAFPKSSTKISGTKTGEDMFGEFSSFIEFDPLRKKDFSLDLGWRYLPLLFVFRDRRKIEKSLCRDERTVEAIAENFYFSAGRSSLKGRNLQNPHAITAAAAVLMKLTLDRFVRQILEWWLAVPECVWLTYIGKKLVGASVILPLTEAAYETIRAGRMSESDISAENDLLYPSRTLFVSCFGPTTQSRFLFHHSLRRILGAMQHVAALIDEVKPSVLPVRVLGFSGTPNSERALLKQGFQSLHQQLPPLKNATLYELILPPPETAELEYSSPQSTNAGIIGFFWRQLRSLDVLKLQQLETIRKHEEKMPW